MILDERLTGRNGRVWAAYIRGATQEAIAAEFGISQQRVSQIIAEVRNSIPEETRTELVRREIELLDHMRHEMMARVDAPPIPAYSQGRPVLLPDGNVAEDHSERVRAVDAVLKISKRLAEAVGFDAPSKSEETSTVRYEIVGVDTGQIE